MSIQHNKNRQSHLHGNARVPRSFIDEAMLKRVAAGGHEHGTSPLAQQLTGATNATTRSNVDEAFYDITGN